jgi:uncharacterized protein (DUF427 family)
MPRAIWNDVVVADSDQTVVVEGNHYFPPDSIEAEYFEPSTLRTVCPWKGVADYHDIIVNGSRNQGAAWFYADPSPAAADIKGYVAFWRGVRVEP